MNEAIKKLYEIAKERNVTMDIRIDPVRIFDPMIRISISNGIRKCGLAFSIDTLSSFRGDYILTKFEEMCEGLNDGKWDDYTGRRSDS